jgi:hypothetical protein
VKERDKKANRKMERKERESNANAYVGVLWKVRERERER